jgi:hypothetical protein
MKTSVLFPLQGLLILLLMYVGVYFRRNRSIHIKLMGTTIIWDLLLIVQIELTRGAVAKAAKAITDPLILNIHVALAVSCVLAYCFMFYSGRKVLKGERDILPKHKFMGITTVILRTAVFITSFFAAS